jgi:hypothetical protein
MSATTHRVCAKAVFAHVMATQHNAVAHLFISQHCFFQMLFDAPNNSFLHHKDNELLFI